MNQQDNLKGNFSLKGFTSIQIGIYILIAAYAIKSILDGFLDKHFSDFSFKENSVILITALVSLAFLFSSSALFYNGKRTAKKQQVQLWNEASKSNLYKYTSSFLILFLTLYFLSKQGHTAYLTPIFLVIYATILFLFKQKEGRELLIMSGVCILFAIICFLIPSYWYSSLFILGVAHITYGVVVK